MRTALWYGDNERCQHLRDSAGDQARAGAMQPAVRTAELSAARTALTNSLAKEARRRRLMAAAPAQMWTRTTAPGTQNAESVKTPRRPSEAHQAGSGPLPLS